MSQLDQGQRSRILYIEQKSGYHDNGPAWIGRVTFSKSGQTLYYRGLQLQRLKGGGVAGNYYDVTTGEEYWVSGVKRDGADRHWAGSGLVHIDEDVREEYRKLLES
ncbi:MAG: hypothetical protein ETSY1_40850 [Candidatus Entotheonella factor]|uniref:1-deoxy-D-xylulose-5-phosphate synthase n=1 Tax=Entotheonella factor TaxID=1429438 RepID=W4L4N8_ENTF1|nr:hypothetical protein [Candidatus Entotheonella palauensis]ETW93073.1 MAG: hypothetical protein ETSY1_40850 [Candidatus Entotheonella factor]